MKRILVVVATVVAATAFAQESLPSPPTGYTWVRLPPTRAAFLKPKEWFFKSEKHDSTDAFFISRENINKVGEFTVGLTINVFHPEEKAADYAVRIMGAYMDRGDVLRMRELNRGPMSGYVGLLRVRGRTAPLMLHLITLANPKTNTAYLILFEAPEAEWDTAWKTGETILRQFMLDDED